MRNKFLLFLFFTGYSATSYCQVLNTNKLDSLFDSIAKYNKAMGSIAISKNGNVAYQRNVGFSLKAGKDSIASTSLTKYQIGSITKLFTATIIFQLIDEKKLSLETKLSDFFPAIPFSNQISIKQLLSHRSGLYDFVNDPKKEWLSKSRTQKEILDVIKTGKPGFAPDKKLSYSNSGYYILTLIAEKISSQRFFELIQKRICNKLALKNTFSAVPGKIIKDIAKPYTLKKGWEEIPDFYFPNVTGVGDMVSTPTELIIFNEALLSGKLISAESLNNMKTCGTQEFCMGIMKVPFESRYAYGHGGDTYGTHSIVTTFEKEKISVAFCNNGEVVNNSDILIGVLRICFDEIYILPDYRAIEYKLESPEQYIGIYSSKKIALKITISKKGTSLFAQATGQEAFMLEPTEKGKFKFDPAGVIIEIDPAKNELYLKQGGQNYLFTKDKNVN